MEFIRTLRQKHQTSKQDNLQRLAEDLITLSDFNGSLYIAFEGVPLIVIDSDWSISDIIEKLNALRSTYVNYRMSI